MSVRLSWEEKPTEIERLSLPFQTVETINASKATRDRDRGSLFSRPRNPPTGICSSWGDNELVMRVCSNSSPAKFAWSTSTRPSIPARTSRSALHVGDVTLTKQPSVLEEHAYRDTWGAWPRVLTSRMMFERIVLIRELLDRQRVPLLALRAEREPLLRRSFAMRFSARTELSRRDYLEARLGPWGREEVVRRFTRSSCSTTKGAESCVESALASRSIRPTREPSTATMTATDRGPYRLDNLTSPNPRPNMTYEWQGFPPPPKGWALQRGHDGRTTTPADGFTNHEDKTKRPQLRRYAGRERRAHLVDDVWDDVSPIKSQAAERTGVSNTQKPEALVERVIKASTNEGDLVADFFWARARRVAAENLRRRWIAATSAVRDPHDAQAPAQRSGLRAVRDPEPRCV